MDRKESPEIHSHIYGQLIYYKGTKHGERTVSSMSSAGKLDSHMKNNEIGALSYIIHKN